MDIRRHDLISEHGVPGFGDLLITVHSKGAIGYWLGVYSCLAPWFRRFKLCAFGNYLTTTWRFKDGYIQKLSDFKLTIVMDFKKWVKKELTYSYYMLS